MRVANFDEAKQAGDFWWTPADNPIRLNFLCPCGCGDVAGIAVEKNLKDRGGNHPVWQWDKNLDNPTITSSIQKIGGCNWHGYLTNGQWKSV